MLRLFHHLLFLKFYNCWDIEKYYKTDLNILIVTHQGLCDTMIKIINKFSPTYKHKLSNELLRNQDYPFVKVFLI